MTIAIGQVDTPEGILVILDPGLARFWRHDGDPGSPRRGEPPCVDLRLAGRDAEAAGRAHGREWNPRFLFDVPAEEAAARVAAFDAFAREGGLEASAQVLPQRVVHTERVRSALEAGGGLGVVTYNGLSAVAASGMPCDRPLDVVATAMPEGDFAGRLAVIDVVVDAAGVPSRTERVAGVMVEHGQLLFSGLGPLGRFRMWESQDGLADFVFWGRDAEHAAKACGAKALPGGQWGWTDLPEVEAGERAEAVQDLADREHLRLGVDWRPHCNLERLNAQIRSSPERTGRLELGGAWACGCDDRWGDGVFAVSRTTDAAGRVLRVRVELGTEERQQLVRAVRQRHR